MVWGFCHIDMVISLPISNVNNQCEFENNMQSMLVITFINPFETKHYMQFTLILTFENYQCEFESMIQFTSTCLLNLLISMASETFFVY